MGLGGAKRTLGEGEGGYTGRGQFLWGELTPLDTLLLVQKYCGLSPNIFYRLEAYDTHVAVACLT